jgi:hypothetical protein
MTVPEEFPELYSDCDDFDPPYGWESIVRRASEKLSTVGNVKILQVKSKYASLRMYYRRADGESGYIEEADDVIKQAEREASKACEDCGEPGIGRKKGGWYYRSCERHVK